MRLLAFACLAYAGFDLPLVVLDRTGLAMFGLGFAALAIGRYAPKPRTPLLRRALASAAPAATGTLTDAQLGALVRQADAAQAVVAGDGYPPSRLDAPEA